MFAKHNPLKSNHALAYRVFGQTFLCPADEQEREQISMIQTEPIATVRSSRWLEHKPGREFLAGRLGSTRLGGARSTDRRQGGSLNIK